MQTVCFSTRRFFIGPCRNATVIQVYISRDVRGGGKLRVFQPQGRFIALPVPASRLTNSYKVRANSCPLLYRKTHLTCALLHGLRFNVASPGRFSGGLWQPAHTSPPGSPDGLGIEPRAASLTIYYNHYNSYNQILGQYIGARLHNSIKSSSPTGV